MESYFRGVIGIIDDEASVCRSLERLLESEGFEVCSFTSSAEFLDSDQLQQTTCLIVDVRMPEQNGLEFQERLRAAGNRVPIIFITGHLDDATLVRALSGGAVEVLEKPLHETDLIHAVKTAGEHRAARP